MHRNTTVRRLAEAGLIAALYTALTVCLTPLSFGLIQCRLAEALTLLAVFTPAAIPGLMAGCALANLLGISLGANVAGMVDVIVGPLATGLAAWLTRRWRGVRPGGFPVLSALPPIVLNALVVGAELALASPHFSLSVLLVQIVLVGAGELIACGVGGLGLVKALESTGAARRLFYSEEK